MELKLQCIKVLMTYNGRIYWQRTWALTDGILAMHPTPRPRFNRSWVITHVATGCRIWDEYEDKAELWAKFEESRNLQWHGLNVMALPTCELITLVPAIELARGRKREGEDWLRRVKPIIAEAVGC